MTTVAVLAVGIVMIYRGLIVALDYQTHLTNRLYANNLLADRIERAQQAYQQKGELPLADDGKALTAYINKVPIVFRMNSSVRNVETLEGVLAVDMALSWAERGRTIRINRTAYITRNKL